MHIVLHSLTGSFGRSLEQRTHVNVESAVGIARGYNFCTSVVAVLAHLGNHDAGLTTLALGEVGAHLLSTHEIGILFGFV